MNPANIPIHGTVEHELHVISRSSAVVTFSVANFVFMNFTSVMALISMSNSETYYEDEEMPENVRLLLTG